MKFRKKKQPRYNPGGIVGEPRPLTPDDVASFIHAANNRSEYPRNITFDWDELDDLLDELYSENKMQVRYLRKQLEWLRVEGTKRNRLWAARPHERKKT